MVLLVTSLFGLNAFGTVLAICECSQYVSNAFEEIDDEIETFDWYLYSHKLQRMLPIILMAAQQPVELNYFGSFSAVRETFKKVSLIQEQSLLPTQS